MHVGLFTVSLEGAGWANIYLNGSSSADGLDPPAVDSGLERGHGRQHRFYLSHNMTTGARLKRKWRRNGDENLNQKPLPATPHHAPHQFPLLFVKLQHYIFSTFLAKEANASAPLLCWWPSASDNDPSGNYYTRNSRFLKFIPLGYVTNRNYWALISFSSPGGDIYESSLATLTRSGDWHSKIPPLLHVYVPANLTMTERSRAGKLLDVLGNNRKVVRNQTGGWNRKNVVAFQGTNHKVENDRECV